MKLRVCIVVLSALLLLSSCSIMEAEETRSIKERVWDSYEAGYSDGSSDGYIDGHKEGYNEGYEDGHDAGYDAGYDEGRYSERDERDIRNDMDNIYGWELDTLYDYFHEPGMVTWEEAAEAIEYICNY